MLLKSHGNKAILLLKFLIFSGAQGGASPLEPSYPSSTELLACVLGGGRPANCRKKLKWKEEKLWKNHKNSLTSGEGAPPPNPVA